MSNYWIVLSGRFTLDALGLIPGFLDESDPRDAIEQFNANYVGGWRPLKGFKRDATTNALEYAGDPPLMPLAMTLLHDDFIHVYDYAWVSVVHPDGSFEVARLD